MVIPLLFPAILLGQEIRESEAAVVAQAPEHRFFSEPFLTVDPTHPTRLLAAAMIEADGSSFEERLERQTCVTFHSLDAGKTWQQQSVPINRCFDPWVAIVPEDQAVFSLIGHDSTAGDGLLVFTSSGGTWRDTPLNLGNGFDHPTIAVDQHSPQRRGRLYILSSRTIQNTQGKRASLSVLQSSDGGKTFPESTQIIPNNLINLAEMPVVLSDGTLMVTFVEAARWGDTLGRLDRFDHWRAWALRSIDGAHTFSSPLFVTDSCGPPPPFQLSAFAADTTSGPFHDRLYFLCGAHNRGPIVLTYSADKGETWSTPVSVPPAIVGTEPRRILGLAVNTKGVVAIGRLDHVAQSGDSCQDLHFIASLDGGLTFLPPKRISSAPCGTFGDYFGMAATPDGRFHLLWPEVREGVSQLRTAIVEVSDRTPAPR